jgi:hypothetical protein
VKAAERGARSATTTAELRNRVWTGSAPEGHECE